MPSGSFVLPVRDERNRRTFGLVMIQSTLWSHLFGLLASPQQQLNVMALAHRKLRADGRLLIETVNPTSLYVYAHAMYDLVVALT